MIRFKLWHFLVIVTLLCLVVPPVMQYLLIDHSEKDIWKNFDQAKARRDLALNKWRASKAAFEGSNGTIQTVAKAAEQYYSEDLAVRQRFEELTKFYDIKLGSNGTVQGSNPKFERAKRRCIENQ